MSSYQECLTDIKLRLLLLGINTKKPVLNVLAYCIWAPILLTSFGLALSDLIFNPEPNYTPALESTFVFIHGLVKLSVLVFKSDTIFELSKDVSESFWNFDGIVNQKQRFKCGKTLGWINFISKLYLRFGSIAVMSIILLPLVTSRELPLYCYVPSFIGLRTMYIFMVISIYPMYVVVFGFDLMVFTFLNLLIIQLKILNNTFANLVFTGHPEETSKNLLICIKQHKFLIKFAGKLSGMLSLPFLIQFVLTVSTLCMEMYQLKKNPDLAVGVISLIIIINISTQVILLYCHPSEYVVHESSRIINSLFSTDWYIVKSKPLKRNLLFTFMRGLKPIKISAEGFMDVDMASSVKIFKTVLSFYSCMNTMDERNGKKY